MIKLFKSLREKVSRKVLAVSVAIAGAVAAPAAFAVGEISPGGTVDPVELARAGFGQLTATYSQMSSDAWKYIVGVIVGFAIIGLFKKFVSKSS
ncbi:hypothetical protein AH865_01780 [Salmonella enterica subsp. enterica serovar Infantis]|nr:hypothetical protein [Salmonella enterica subsp. enterica serovar Infantis]EGI5074291.1 hypothetical protein [Salmonella enterica subsp. enterica serovar Infantis]